MQVKASEAILTVADSALVRGEAEQVMYAMSMNHAHATKAPYQAGWVIAAGQPTGKPGPRRDAVCVESLIFSLASVECLSLPISWQQER